jgi:hypothetical protein
MDKLIDVFLRAPVYVVLTVCGLVFLFVGLIGRIKDWFDPDKTSRVLLSVIGIFLVVFAIWRQRSELTSSDLSPDPSKVKKNLYRPMSPPDLEIQKIVADAEFRFDKALGKLKSRSEDWEIYDTQLGFSRCLDRPVILRLTNTRWSTWQCTIAPENWDMKVVAAWLDETAKAIAQGLPPYWEVLISPPPDTSDIRLKARDPANRIILTVKLADSKNGVNGIFTVEIKS